MPRTPGTIRLRPRRGNCRAISTLLGTRAGWFNRLAVAFFGGTRRASFWYPIGKAARNVVLKVLGIRYIDNLGRARDAAVRSG